MDYFATSVALATAYLKAGFDGCKKANQSTYEEHNDVHGGDVGITDSLVGIAEYIEDTLSKDYTCANYDGVIQYELYEDKLGPWLFYHPDYFLTSKPSSEFKAHLQTTLAEWFSKSNPPAQATNQESTTMTVNELITQLQRLDGALPVLTRGSEPQKMVDALEVRVIKTAHRQAVFIGKPKVQAD
jgi:hypothetical protein